MTDAAPDSVSSSEYLKKVAQWFDMTGGEGLTAADARLLAYRLRQIAEGAQFITMRP